MRKVAATSGAERHGGRPDLLALVEVMGPATRCVSPRATGWLDLRTATESVPPRIAPGRFGDARSTSVRGPGQKAFIRLRAASHQQDQRLSRVATLEIEHPLHCPRVERVGTQAVDRLRRIGDHAAPPDHIRCRAKGIEVVIERVCEQCMDHVDTKYACRRSPVNVLVLEPLPRPLSRRKRVENTRGGRGA